MPDGRWGSDGVVKKHLIGEYNKFHCLIPPPSINSDGPLTTNITDWQVGNIGP